MQNFRSEKCLKETKLTSIRIHEQKSLVMIRVACSVQQFLSSEVMAAFNDIKADKLKCRQRLIHIGNLRGEK